MSDFLKVSSSVFLLFVIENLTQYGVSGIQQQQINDRCVMKSLGVEWL